MTQEEKIYTDEETKILVTILRRKIRELFGDKIQGLEKVQYPEDFGPLVRKSFANDAEVEKYLEENNISWRGMFDEAEEETYIESEAKQKC